MAQNIGTQLSESTVGFIGLGNMGFGMAMNVRKNLPPTAKLVVCELDQARKEQFMEQAKKKKYANVESAGTPKEIAKRCVRQLDCDQCQPTLNTPYRRSSSSLRYPVEPLYQSLHRSRIRATSHATVCSDEKTLLGHIHYKVSTSLQVLEQIESGEHGDFLDAPVSGGIPSAHEGKLVFMVGGPGDLFRRARHVFELMGNEFFHCGKAGAGLATKQIHNYIAYCSHIGLCEAVNAGVKYGLDPKTLSDVINASSGCCWNSLNMFPVKGVQPNSSASRDFEGGFKIELAKGVIDMAVQLMDEVHGKHVLGNVLKDVYSRAVESPLCKDQESRSIFRLFTEEDGTILGNSKVEQTTPPQPPPP